MAPKYIKFGSDQEDDYDHNCYHHNQYQQNTKVRQISLSRSKNSFENSPSSANNANKMPTTKSDSTKFTSPSSSNVRCRASGLSSTNQRSLSFTSSSTINHLHNHNKYCSSHMGTPTTDPQSTNQLLSININKLSSTTSLDTPTTTTTTNNNIKSKMFFKATMPFSSSTFKDNRMLLPLLFVACCCLFGSTVEACGYPGSPAHAMVTMTTEKISPGTVATYTCDNGYELLGPSRRLCNQNGTWTPQGIPFCVLNVAVGKAAMQSSSVGQGSAQKAVDGSTSSFYNPSTCTMTEAERTPWFYVNLLEPVLVQLVRIDFGSACCSGNRPAVITVRVGNNRPDLGVNPVCNKFTGFIEEGRPLFLPCARPMPGAFVSITLESQGNPLSICEIFVYTDHALSIEQCPSFRDQPLGSTSTYNGKCYIFYNNQPMTFDNAKRFCEIRGGTLVDETSPALQGFLSWELYRRHRNDPNGQYWLGAVRDPKSTQNWKWINGKDVTISFWNLPSSRENCSRFDGTKGWLWSDTNCGLKLNFMCQHRPLSCGKPERPANSTILARSVDIGSVIEYRCGEGSMLIGPNIRTCLPNGFFSEFSPKCKFIECGFPASISNGQYSLNNGTRSYLSTLTYHCTEGYVLVGRAHLVCDADARWNGPPPRCEPVLCPNPPLIANGFATLNSNSTIFGSRADYSCEIGYELIGERSIICNTVGYWDGQPGYCLEVTPTSPFTTPTTTTTTTSTTTTPVPTTFSNTPSAGTSSPGQQQQFSNRFTSTDIWRISPSVTTKKPIIALLPVSTGSSSSSSSSSLNPSIPGLSSSSASINPYTRVTNTPTTTTTTTSSTSSSSSSNGGSALNGNTDPGHHHNHHHQLHHVPNTTPAPITKIISMTSSTSSGSPSSGTTSLTSTTGTSTGTGTTQRKSNGIHSVSSFHRPTTSRPQHPIIRISDNEIADSNYGPGDSSSNGFASKPSKIAAARLNMGGIIALGVFGGFVFLAAVITIIVIIIRRVKHSHSSLDAQTISTFDSSNGDNPGFYHKYASAWSQLQSSAAVLHSGSYKPSMARLDPYEHHFTSAAAAGAAQNRRSSNLNNNGTMGGAINEGFRDTNEITLNADVYTRSSSGGSGGSSSNNGGHDERRRYSGGKRGSGGGGGGGSDHEWQHLTRAKY